MVAASMLPPRSAARIISSAACCQEPRSWIWSGSFRMKVRTSASVASVVPSLNTIVRVSRADQPLPEAFAIRDSPSPAHLVPLALAERICLTFDRVDPARVHGSFDRFQTPGTFDEFLRSTPPITTNYELTFRSGRTGADARQAWVCTRAVTAVPDIRK